MLSFVEDPGAANFIAPLVDSFQQVGTRCVVLAAGLARDIFRRRSVPHREMAAGASAESVLAEFRPRLLLVGTAMNRDTLGLQLVAAARSRSIVTVGAVDAAMNSDLRFRGRAAEPLAFAPDWLLVPDAVTVASFVELGMPAGRVLATGNPHYDYVIDQGEKWYGEDREALCRRVFPSAPANRKILVFVSEGSARVLGTRPERMAAYSFAGRGNLSGRTEIALEEVLDALLGMLPRPYVVLRAHPKDDLGDFAAYAQEISMISAGGNALEIVFAADLVAGTTSMLVTEAALLGRPTVAMVPVPEEARWLPSIELGLTRVATTRADVARLLQEGLRSTVAETEVASVRGARERATAALLRVLSSSTA